MLMRRYAASIATALVALALLAGCGSSKSDSSASTSTTKASGSGYGGSQTQATTTSSDSGAGAAKLTATSGEHGTYLADANGKVVYLWEKDTTTKSECDGACAQAWPPVTTSGAPQAGSGANASMLGTTKRADGTTQVTYNGHPLYYYAGDTNAGDTNGQGSHGFGAGWYVITPKGKKIDDD
jgi:predicted lipoprotein with Yx(FWY)xxD motif